MKKQKVTIKMLTWSQERKGAIEVDPKGNWKTSEMSPRFLVNTDRGQQWVSIPGLPAEDVVNTWLKQNGI